MYYYRKILRLGATLVAIAALTYGVGRAYYFLTDGFTVSNIYSTLPTTPQGIRKPTDEEREHIAAILGQRFTYLGKGCQSYVFGSEDGQYVIKFIKHQRFRCKPWLDAVAFLPWASRHRQERMAHKNEKHARLLEGWKTAFNALPLQTAVLWLHLDNSNNNADISSNPEPTTLTLVDKLGYTHRIDLNRCEYLVQRHAPMFTPVLEQLIDSGAEEQGRHLLDQILALIADTYQSGFIDGDHAIMQNTGVLNGHPLHIDVGQLTADASSRDPAVYRQALFNKTYRLRLWLKEHSPALQTYLEERLLTIIGEEFYTMKPHFDV